MLKYLRILLSPIESVIVSQVPVNYKVMNFFNFIIKKPLYNCKFQMFNAHNYGFVMKHNLFNKMNNVKNIFSEL